MPFVDQGMAMDQGASWAMDEFGKAHMGDARLTKRLIKLADRLGDAPSASIPGACNGHAETQAAYRFLDQARTDKRDVCWETVLAPHMARTEARMGEHSVVLCLQDTTELDFNGQAIDGLGSLSYAAQRGMYLHPTYAVTPQRLPLGILDAWMWARPLDVVESQRWIEGYERVAERAGQFPDTRLVYVADREADILELMQRAHALAHPADYLLRAQHNRCLPRGGKKHPPCAKSFAVSPCWAVSSPAKAMASQASKPCGWALPESAASFEASRRCGRFMHYELCGMVCPKLLDSIMLAGLDSKKALQPVSTHEMEDSNHGRSEIRRCHAFDATELIYKSEDWKDLASFAVVERVRTVGNQTSTERAYYISSLPAVAERIANAVRSHWEVENRLHWCLDVQFNDDQSRVRSGYAANNLAVVRHIVMNLLRLDSTRKASLKSKRMLAATLDDYRAVLLGLMP